MARFCGKVGFSITEETSPGVYKDSIKEKTFYGDVINYTSRWETGSGVEDDLNIDTEISIMADPYAIEHFSNIKYVHYMGANWKVRSAVPNSPRIILRLGGIYNGQQD